MKTFLMLYFMLTITTALAKEKTAPLTPATAATPATASDTPGIKVTDVEESAVLRQMGIRNGDIIKKIDDKPIGTAREAMEAYNKLKTSKKSSVEIIRNGKVQTLTYEVK